MKKGLLLLFAILISTVTFAQQELRVTDGSIHVKSDLNDFKVFPNPTRNNLTVAIGELTEGVSFQINDILGKLVYDRKITSYDLQQNNFKLDMSPFKEGIYMFSLKTKTASKTIRVVKL